MTTRLHLCLKGTYRPLCGSPDRARATLYPDLLPLTILPEEVPCGQCICLAVEKGIQPVARPFHPHSRVA